MSDRKRSLPVFAGRTDWDLAPSRVAAALAARRAAGLPVLDLTESKPTRCGFAPAGEGVLDALARPESLRYPRPRWACPRRAQSRR